MRKLPILFLCLLVSAGFSTNYPVNACGTYTLASADIFNLTADISATDTSTITNGACIYILFAGVPSTPPVMWFNNKTITNINSSATIGLFIRHNMATTGSGEIRSPSTASGNELTITINNFQIAFYAHQNVTSTGQSNIFLNYGLKLTAKNGNYAIYQNCTAGKESLCIMGSSGAQRVNFSACNMSGGILRTINTSGNIIYQNPDSGAGCNNSFYNVSAMIATPGNVSGGAVLPVPFLYSNKLFSANGFIDGANYNTTDAFNIRLKNVNYTYSNTSANNYLFWNSFECGNGYCPSYFWAANATTLSNLTGKNYYCVGGYCNPLLFQNFSAFPFYIHTPDSLQPVKLSNNYTFLKIFWRQGLEYYLIASSNDYAKDKTFYLQPNGEYEIEINNGTNTTNTTIVNECPSSFSLCYITLAGGSYTLTVSTFDELWNDINFSIYYNNGTKNYTTATNFLKENVNITYRINSSESSLEYYGFNVSKYYNGTTTYICSQNITNNTNGSILECETNGTGKYVTRVWFKSTDWLEYRPSAKALFIGNATGFASIGAALSQGNIISGWAYALFALIITALAIGFASRFWESGSGVIGLAVFWFFAVVWNAAIYPTGIGDFTMGHLGVLGTIAVIGTLVYKQYI